MRNHYLYELEGIDGDKITEVDSPLVLKTKLLSLKKEKLVQK